MTFTEVRGRKELDCGKSNPQLLSHANIVSQEIFTMSIANQCCASGPSGPQYLSAVKQEEDVTSVRATTLAR